ncbi:MAG: Hdr-like menaquinol oxidoreductase cytochrome c subunit [Rhodospirillales bacterium]|nr:Hdr-like menaquinol oxidoreductase cytochrome c subunit [Rhodospirillales bacterium]
MRWLPKLSLNFVLAAVFVIGLAAGLVTAPVEAAEGGRVFVPSPPKGKGNQCVRDTAFMRANHMNLLLHQRDETMRKGVRTKQYSLKECIACHAVPGNDGQPVSYEDPKNFCRSCHDYVAVKLDCFECHASKPPQGKGHASTLPNARNAYRVSGGLPQ